MLTLSPTSVRLSLKGQDSQEFKVSSSTPGETFGIASSDEQVATVFPEETIDAFTVKGRKLGSASILVKTFVGSAGSEEATVVVTVVA